MVWKTLTYGPGRESNQGHLGERRALYAQANRVTHKVVNIKTIIQINLMSLFCSPLYSASNCFIHGRAKDSGVS